MHDEIFKFFNFHKFHEFFENFKAVFCEIFSEINYLQYRSYR